MLHLQWGFVGRGRLLGIKNDDDDDDDNKG